MKNYLLCFFVLCTGLTLLPLAPAVFPADKPAETGMLSVLRSSDGTVYELPVEDYVIGRLESAGYEYGEETMKALAVAVRSCALYCEANRPAHAEAAVCDDPACCAAFRTDFFSERSVRAAAETAGMFLTDGKGAIAAVTHESSGGLTECAEAVYGVSLPYLISVREESEEPSASVFVTEKDFFALLGAPVCDPEDIAVTYDRAKRIRTVALGKTELAGASFASALGLPSLFCTVEAEEGGFLLTCFGKGDGVGMSREGASRMEEAGRSFRDILAFYFPGAEIASG